MCARAQVCVSQYVAAPGCPRGYAGPGGLHMSAHNITLQNCTGGIAGYIDRYFTPFLTFSLTRLIQRVWYIPYQAETYPC
jgi:hypothetical protein